MLKKLKYEDWLKARKDYVTATEVASLLGLNPFQSANKMYEEKQNSTFLENAHVLVGRWLESAVIDATNHYLKTDFKPYGNPDEKWLYVDETVRYGATPDAHNAKALLECKTTGSANLLKYSQFAPEQYVCQLTVQLMLNSKDYGYITIMDANLMPFKASNGAISPVNIFKIQKSKVLSDLILQEVPRFWECVNEGKNYRVSSKTKTWAKLACMTCQEKVL